MSDSGLGHEAKAKRKRVKKKSSSGATEKGEQAEPQPR